MAGGLMLEDVGIEVASGRDFGLYDELWVSGPGL